MSYNKRYEVPNIEEIRATARQHEEVFSTKHINKLKKNRKKLKREQENYTKKLIKSLSKKIVKRARNGDFFLVVPLNVSEIPYSLDWLRHELVTNFKGYRVELDIFTPELLIPIFISWAKE